MRTDLLPPNSTALEQALAQIGAGILELDDDAAIRGCKFDPPDNWLDALIYEYALGEITPYFDDKRRLIREGIRWSRCRGTPRSLHLAFAWVGLSADIIEPGPSAETNDPNASYQPHRHFAEYDLRPHGVLTPEQICLLVRLALLSQPVRSRLWRLVYGHDRGVFKLDHSPLDCDLLDDDSGIRIGRTDLPCLPPGSDPKISFRQRHASRAIREESEAWAVVIITVASHAVSRESHVLYLDDLPLPFEIYTALSAAGNPRGVAVYYGQVWADQPWPRSNWTNTNAIISNCKEPD